MSSTRPKGLTTREVARFLGRSPATLERWRRRGLYTPSASYTQGQIKVHLHTPDDIKRLSQIARETKAGRPKKESTDG